MATHEFRHIREDMHVTSGDLWFCYFTTSVKKKKTLNVSEKIHPLHKPNSLYAYLIFEEIEN